MIVRYPGTDDFSINDSDWTEDMSALESALARLPLYPDDEYRLYGQDGFLVAVEEIRRRYGDARIAVLLTSLDELVCRPDYGDLMELAGAAEQAALVLAEVHCRFRRNRHALERYYDKKRRRAEERREADRTTRHGFRRRS